MRIKLPLITQLVIAVCLYSANPAVAQVSKAVQAAVEAGVEAFAKKEASVLARFGGKEAVQAVFTAAEREGGGALIARLERAALAHGPEIIQGAKVSPTKFLSAFESLEPGLQRSALAGIARTPELMAKLIAEMGHEVLKVEATHPGIGIKIAQELGADGARLATTLTTDQAAQLSGLAKAIGTGPATSVQRSELLEVIRKVPKKAMSLLEGHPKVLMTGAVLAAFLASKDNLLGNEECTALPDGTIVKSGKIGLIAWAMREFHTLLYLVGAAFMIWAGIKIWGTYRVTRAKIVQVESPQPPVPNKPG